MRTLTRIYRSTCPSKFFQLVSSSFDHLMEPRDGHSRSLRNFCFAGRCLYHPYALLVIFVLMLQLYFPSLCLLFPLKLLPCIGDSYLPPSNGTPSRQALCHRRDRRIVGRDFDHYYIQVLRCSLIRQAGVYECCSLIQAGHWIEPARRPSKASIRRARLTSILFDRSNATYGYLGCAKG